MKIEKKIYSYKEICEKFICYKDMTPSEYQYLIYSLVEYVRNKFNMQNILVTFNLDPNSKSDAITNVGESVQFKKTMLQKSYENPCQLFNSYITILHEFAHNIDWRQNETKSNNKREFISNKSKALLELTKYKPEKKALYDDLAYAIYYCSRSEVFARQKALKESRQLVDDLIALAKSEYEADEYFVNLVEDEHKNEFAVLDTETRKNILANKNARNFSLYRQYLECDASLQLDNAINTQILDTMEAKNDFVEIANDMLDVNNINLRITEDDKKKLADILFVPGFYDDKLAHAFYDYFENGKEYQACQKIAKIKEFELSSKQEKTLNNGLKHLQSRQEIDFIK